MTTETNEAFLTYCQTRGDDQFSYNAVYDCAYAQFLKDTGVCPNPIVGSSDWNPRDRPQFNYRIPSETADVLYLNKRGTFADVATALSARLEAAL